MAKKYTDCDPPLREEMPLLYSSLAAGVEVRAWFAPDGALTIWWFDKEEDGEWVPDEGPRVPVGAFTRLAELLLDKI